MRKASYRTFPTKTDSRWWKSKINKNNHENSRENMGEYFYNIGRRKAFLSMIWNVKAIMETDEFDYRKMDDFHIEKKQTNIKLEWRF